MLLFSLSINNTFSQTYTSNNNYTGAWELSVSWMPGWTTPVTAINNGSDFNIYGYITVNGSLSFNGLASSLTIYDTLLIIGNLSFGNNNNLQINDNGILIVRGNLTIDNNTVINTNGHLIVTGNIIKAGSIDNGSFSSNDNPVKTFIGGTIPPNLTNNNIGYQVLNCTLPVTIRYLNSNCSYGNMIDLINDPVYPFYQTTCSVITPTITVNGPSSFCMGGSVTLTSSAAAGYKWSTGESTASIVVKISGSYTVRTTSTSGCTSTLSLPQVVNVYSTPVEPAISAGGPTTFCEGGSVNLTSSAGNTYLWSTGETSPVIIARTSGSYSVRVTDANGCQSPKSLLTTVNVIPLPTVNITSTNNPMCIYDQRTLSAAPPGGTFRVIDGPGTIIGNVLAATGTGVINLEYDITGVCTVIAVQSITVNQNSVSIPGPDQELNYTFETATNATLSPSEEGEWSLISGSGNISDVHSPTTVITNLSLGENIFLWKVMNGNCTDSSEIRITVKEIFIPNVITPDGDGKNDYFRIDQYTGKMELLIINKWGNAEYLNYNYMNDWDGRNKKGVRLPADTYFYIIKLADGKIFKGSVLILR